MLTKYLIAAIVALSLALGGMGYLFKRQIAQTAKAVAEAQQSAEALKTAQAALERQRALSAKLSKEKAATAREGASLRLQLDRALSAHKEWADQPVPKEVQDALAP